MPVLKSSPTPKVEPSHPPTPTLPSDPDKIVLCVVDNRRLTQATVNRILATMLRGRNDALEHAERQRLVYTQNIMQEWLDRNLLAAEAEKEGITVSDEEIKQQEQALKEAAQVNFNVEDALRQIGETKEEYYKQLRDALMGEKLVKRRIITYYPEASLRAIFEKDPVAFQRPPRVRASHVFCPLTGEETSEEKKVRRRFMEKARKEARKGRDLRQVAEEADPALGALGGDLGWLYPTNRLPQPINSLVFKLNKGDVSDVEETRYGYYVIRLEEKQPLQGRTYEEAREAVMDTVFDEVRQKVLDAARSGHKVIINISGIPPDKLD